MSRSGSVFLLFVIVFSLVWNVQSTIPMVLPLPPSDGPLAADQGYVGFRHPPLPSGFLDQASYLVDSTDDAEYTVSHVSGPSTQMLWLERLTHRDVSGQPYFEVRATVELPKLGERDVVVFGRCRLNGVANPQMIAVVHYQDAELFKEIKQVWRVNREGERFETLPTEGVTCVNEGYGA